MATIAERAGIPSSKYERFRWFAWAVLGYTVLVVLWGAYVRATGSGAGCGNHWPLCNGEVLPRAPRAETVIEFSHRLTSGLSLIAVIGLCFWSFRLFPRRHLVRVAAALSVAFLFVEALLGAGLVVFRFVAEDASAGRAVYLSAHLVNTQVLLAMLVMTAWFVNKPASWRSRSEWPKGLLAAVPVALFISISGAVAALGDTLFPASSLAAGVQQELSAASGTLLRLRLLHPAIAIIGAGYVLFAALEIVRSKPSSSAKAAGWMVALLVFIQLIAGAVNVTLLAPVWMQLVHLLVANLLWLSLVILVVETIRKPVAEGSLDSAAGGSN